jgi:Holliday junction DNA helicase RuvA
VIWKRVQVGVRFGFVIGRLSGILVDQTLDGACVLDVNGVGYEVFVPLGALGKLPASTQTVLHIHTHVREDAIILYGFPTLDDRAAFRVLIGVSGIGPRLALGILSSLSATELADAIQRGDKARFKGVSGVGPKLVGRLVLELKDKLDFVRVPGGVLPAAPRAKAMPGYDGVLGTVHAALVQMGFKPGEAEQAVRKIESAADGKQPEELLREALTSLS